MILQLGYIIFIEILDILTSLLTQSYDISITTPSSTIIKDQKLQVIVSFSIPLGLKIPLEFPESNNLRIKTESLWSHETERNKKKP